MQLPDCSYLKSGRSDSLALRASASVNRRPLQPHCSAPTQLDQLRESVGAGTRRAVTRGAEVGGTLSAARDKDLTPAAAPTDACPSQRLFNCVVGH